MTDFRSSAFGLEVEDLLDAHHKIDEWLSTAGRHAIYIVEITRGSIRSVSSGVDVSTNRVLPFWRVEIAGPPRTDGDPGMDLYGIGMSDAVDDKVSRLALAVERAFDDFAKRNGS